VKPSRIVFSTLSLLLVSIAIANCGSNGSQNPLTPDTGSPGPSGATITIRAGGVVDPKTVTISIGQSVTFINADTRSHEMDSDPHPQHTNCPSMNAVGLIQPGQSKLTNSFSGATSCGFHDHGDSANTNLQGRINIQ
jgi:plastocyanin